MEFHMRSRLAACLAVACIVAFAATCPSFAREILTPEEIAERDLEAKKDAPPVLAVEPGELRADIAGGETRSLRLTVKNVGGGTLAWSLSSTPRWARPDRLSGELGFQEEAGLVLLIDPAETRVGAAGGEARGVIVIEARSVQRRGPDDAAPPVEGSPTNVPVVVGIPAGSVSDAAAPGGEPVLECTPATLTRTIKQGERADLRVTIRNAGTGRMSWYVSSAPEWALIDTRSGELDPGSERPLFLRIDAGRLGTGKRAGNLVIESSRGSQRVASVPVLMNVRYQQVGRWTLNARYWPQVNADPASGEPRSGSGGGGLEFSRAWDISPAIIGLNFGACNFPTDDVFTTVNRMAAVAGLKLELPAGSRLRGYLEAGYGWVQLSADFAGTWIDIDGNGPYAGVGVVCSLARRLSIDATVRVLNWSSYDAEIPYDESVVAAGLGLLIHY
jgi:hypothetical protein